MNWQFWLAVTAMALFFEASLMAANPDLWKKVMSEIVQKPSPVLRKIAFAEIAAACAILLVLRFFG